MPDFTKITPEQIDMAKKAASADELQAMAKDAGIELDAQESATLFARLHGEGELDDDAAGTVSGGQVLTPIPGGACD